MSDLKAYDIADQLVPHLQHTRFDSGKNRWEALLEGTTDKWSGVNPHEAMYEIDEALRTKLEITGYSMSFLKEVTEFLEIRLLNR